MDTILQDIRCPAISTPWESGWSKAATFPMPTRARLRRWPSSTRPSRAGIALHVRLDTSPLQLAATLLTILAGLALVLSAIGLYSLMAYGLARRRREFGVRLALGATRGSILRLVVGRGLTLAAGGVAAGILLALAVRRALEPLPVGVSPVVVAALAGAVAVLPAVACLASYVPARVASRIEPMAALRTDSRQLFPLAVGPPQRELTLTLTLTLTPRRGFAVRGAVWPQALCCDSLILSPRGLVR